MHDRVHVDAPKIGVGQKRLELIGFIEGMFTSFDPGCVRTEYLIKGLYERLDAEGREAAMARWRAERRAAKGTVTAS